jgi:hypothetical protein
MKSEQVYTLKEVVVAYFIVIFLHSSGGTEKNRKYLNLG